MVKLETYEKGTQRQFQAIFAGLYILTFKEEMVPKSYEAVRDKLDNFWGHGLSIPTGGSAWGKEKKESLYPEVVKRLKKTFFRPEPRRSVVQLNSRLYVEGLLQGPVAEEPLIELKQGFCELADPPVEDANLFENVLQTAVAMANYSQDSEGLILIGVADKESAATRVKELFGVDAVIVAGQSVVGTEEQITHLGFDVDKWWRRWQSRIRTAPVSQEFANALAQSFKPVYCDGKLIWEMRPKSLGKPISHGGRFFVRVGSSTEELSADEFLANMAINFR